MFWALVKKEVRLQRSNITFALVIVLIWGLSFSLSIMKDTPLGSKILTTGKLSQIIYYFFVLPCLLVLFPLLVGSTTVAYERKLGIMEWQSSVPVSRRMQWIIKTGSLQASYAF